MLAECLDVPVVEVGEHVGSMLLQGAAQRGDLDQSLQAPDTPESPDSLGRSKVRRMGSARTLLRDFGVYPRHAAPTAYATSATPYNCEMPPCYSNDTARLAATTDLRRLSSADIRRRRRRAMIAASANPTT